VTEGRRWQVRPADDARAWLDEALSLPWRDPFEPDLLVTQLSWQPDGRSMIRPGVPYGFRRVQVSAGPAVTGVSIGMDEWTPSQWDLEGLAPLWLRHDSFLRAAALVSAVLDREPDHTYDGLPNDRTARWSLDACQVRVALHCTGCKLEVRRPPRPPRASQRDDSHPGWPSLIDALVDDLTQRRDEGALIIELATDDRKFVSLTWGGHGAVAEAFGPDPAVLSARGWGPTGGGAGAWLFNQTDLLECRSAIAASVEALQLAGAESTASLRYSASLLDRPGPLTIRALGLAWRTLPPALWQTRGTGAALPLSPAAADDAHYEALFGPMRGGNRPVALLCRLDGPSIVWDGRLHSAWVEQASGLGTADPGHEHVRVDRLTAERIALALTGLPLPALTHGD